MTIAALRAIQEQEQAEVHDHAPPHHPHCLSKEAPAAPNNDPEQLTVGQLLAWANQHADPDVQNQGAQARDVLAGLRQRHAAEAELAAITTEAEQLEQRLAALRAREAELAPPKQKAKRKPAGYAAAEVRAWAKANGVDCPVTGRVPGAVVDAWRQATGATEGEAR